MAIHPATLHAPLTSFLNSVAGKVGDIAPDRLDRLNDIAAWVQSRLDEGTEISIMFICTHNSRRSHFTQIIAKAIADHNGLAGIHTYSGGTEATAMHPNVVTALTSIGFEVAIQEPGDNPRYAIHYAQGVPPIVAWSKVYTDEVNPKRDFLAVMTCSEADEACPMVFGAAQRVSLPYEDPKKSDGTAQQAEVYLSRATHIATELWYIFSRIQRK